MENHISLEKGGSGSRNLPEEDMETPVFLSSMVVDPLSLDHNCLFFGDRELYKSASITEDFDLFQNSRNSQLQPKTTCKRSSVPHDASDCVSAWLWPYHGSQVLDSNFGTDLYDNTTFEPSPSGEYFCTQYSISEINMETPLFDQISLCLRDQNSYSSAADFEDAEWLKTTIRSLFDSANPRSSSLDELNARHPDVDFEGASFADLVHEILSSVMISSGRNAHIIFLKDMKLNTLIPLESLGLRNWIIELSRETSPRIEETTKALSNEEALSLLVLLEFVLHCECGILHRQHCRKAMRLIQKIAVEHHILPPKLELKGIEPAKHPFGGGGYSDVYKGSWNEISICIKRLRIYLDPEEASIEPHKDKVIHAFLKEVLIWKQLTHPNILPFMGVSSTCFPHQMSLISPYMKNGDIMNYLARVSQEHSPTYAKRLGWLLGAARGMKYIHSMNIYHGDIKGANILIGDDDEALLADLGISSVAWSMSETLGWKTATAGGFKGSLRWMSPEVIIDSAPAKTTARDVYAFGSTILEVVTGCSPWSNVREDTKVILNLSQGKHPDRPSGFGDDIWSIVELCWALNPLERLPAATIFDRCRISLSILRKTFRPLNFRDESINSSSSDLDSLSPGRSIIYISSFKLTAKTGL
ncbi:kinase-like domain-containing protein [Flagelloscypha sp. PMI_526]|nr:kinase-like domain-containing protein [Flagelloscypha sp. PMI_526]